MQFTQHPNRWNPQLDVGLMKTYAVLTPKATHTRPAACSEVDCPHYLRGWRTVIDESTELGQRQAWYIRNQSGRAYTEDRDQQPGLTVFTFEAGQSCFSEHTIQTRPELYVVRGGDWRGNPVGDKRIHDRPEHWVEDFAEHQDGIRRQIEKG